MLLQAFNRPEGTATAFRSQLSTQVPLATLIFKLRPSPGPCCSPAPTPASCQSDSCALRTRLSQPPLQTPPLLGILSSSRRTTTCCPSLASSPSPGGRWCSVNMAEHGMKLVLSPGMLGCQQAKETLVQTGLPLQNYSQDKMRNSCHIASRGGFGVKGTVTCSLHAA